LEQQSKILIEYYHPRREFLTMKMYQPLIDVKHTVKLRGCLVVWLRMRFTRSHRYYRLVKEKTQVYAGRTHQKYGCAAGFVEA
jgi:hypothetical protein